MTRKSKDTIRKFHFQTGDTILTVLFFASISLTVWGINIYRLTIIDAKYLFAATAFGMITAFALLPWLVKSSFSTVWTFLIKAVIGGGLFYFGLLFFNQQFTDKEFQTEKFKIIKKGTLGRGKSSRCLQPYVDIDFYGTEKELVFYCDYAEQVKRSTKVSLTYAKGALGFFVIKSKQLTD